MQEIWKDIEGYEGLYQVSNFGRVKSIKTGKLKAQNLNSTGYYRVDLWKENKNKKYFVHKLVASAFLININNSPCINHKDCNRKNNHISNLEFCTQRENMQKASIDSENFKKRNKQVAQYDINGNFIKEYRNIKEAKEITKISDSNIVSVCKNKRKKAGGFIWEYIN